MKKVVSFCFLSLLLAFTSIGVKAQSGLVLDPPNLPNPMQVNVSDTFYISPISSCFDALGLQDNDKISIEWKIFKDGQLIPDDSLSEYFNEFKFETRFDIGNAVRWWGKGYTSEYCNDGDGHGSFPGAYTPQLGNDNDCERTGHFIVSLPGQNNQYEFDYFYVRFFRDTVNTAHRLIVNPKVQANYEFVLELYRRCNGTKWDLFWVAGDETYYAGGHQSELCGMLSSDTLRQTDTASLDTVTICVGDTFYYGTNPVQAFFEATPADQLDTAYFYNISSCNTAVDSVITFFLVIENPLAPALDTANSILQLCDSGYASIIAIPQQAGAQGQVIWFDGSGAAIDTLDNGEALEPYFPLGFTGDSTFSAISYNPLSTCESPDTLHVTVEVYPSPVPNVTADTICADNELHVYLDARYTTHQWYFEGTEITGATDTAYTVADAQPANSGWYRVDVTEEHAHTLYTLSTSCAATDSAYAKVYARPTVAMTGFNGETFNVKDTTISAFICPKDTVLTIVATITPGDTTIVESSILWSSGFTGNDTNVMTVPSTCNTQYKDTLYYAIDENGCTLKDTASIAFTINDTIKPVITVAPDTVMAQMKGSDCEYKVPDLISLVTATDNCDSLVYTQSMDTTDFIADTTIITVTVTDMCGNSVDTNIVVTIPAHVTLNIDTVVKVLCFGDANGEIEVSIAEGHAPYTVTLTNGTVTKDTTMAAAGVAHFTGLTADTWTATVTDANGCTATADTSVAAPNMLTLSAVGTNLICYNDNTGKLHFDINGGTPPYHTTIGTVLDTTYRVTNFTHSDSVVNLAAGTYMITVTDSNNCSVDTNITLTQPDSLYINNFVTINVDCYGNATGSAAPIVLGGTLPYSFAWKMGDSTLITTDSLTGRILTAGTYTSIITDAHGCTAQKDTIITEPQKLEIVSVALPVGQCPYLATYEVSTVISGGSADYTYDWVVDGNPLASHTSSALKDTNNFAETLDPDLCNHLYRITLTVTDDSACVATKEDSVRIFDTLRPVVVGAIADTTVDDCSVAGATLAYTNVHDLMVAFPQLTITDNCSDTMYMTLTYADVASATDCPITVTRTYTLADRCGNDTAFSYVITIQDTTPPSFVRPNDTIVYRLADCSVDTATATLGVPTVSIDNCTTGLTPSYRDEDITPADACPGNTTIRRIWHLEDACGNVATSDSVQTITILDTIAPTLTLTIDSMMLDCNSPFLTTYHNQISAPANATATDACSAVTITIDTIVVPGACKYTYTEKYVFRATDECGNYVEDSAFLYVIDTIAPTFDVVPAPQVFECNSNADEGLNAWLDQLVFSDLCLEHDSIVSDTLKIWTDGTCGNTGEWKVIWTLSDGCNTATDSSTFTVVDHTAPQLLNVPDRHKYVECDGFGNQREFKDWLNSIQAVDECGNTTIDIYYHTDLNTYEVIDTVHADADGHYAGWMDTSATHNGCEGYYDILWIARDECGNEERAEERFVIQDLTGPYFEEPSDTTIACEFAVPTPREACETWANRIAVAFDSCAQRNFTVVNDAHTTQFHRACSNNTGHFNVVWTATDACGNVTTYSKRFTIIDTVAPIIAGAVNDTIQNDTLRVTHNNCSPVLPAFNQTTVGNMIANGAITGVTDCSVTDETAIFFTYSFLTTDGCSKIYLRTYTLADQCNNIATFYQKYVLVDEEAPVLDLTALRTDTIYFTDENCAFEVPARIADITTYAQFEALDGSAEDCNIDNVTITHDVTPNDTLKSGCLWLITYHYIMSDGCGNSSPFDVSVAIKDTAAPVIAGTIADSTWRTNFCTYKTEINTQFPEFTTVQEVLDYANGTLTISDCNLDLTSPLAVVKSADTTGTCPTVITRRYTVKDECNNESAVFTQVINVLDTMPAQIAGTLNDSIVYYGDPTACEIPTVATFASLSDLDAYITVSGSSLTYDDCNNSQVVLDSTVNSGTPCDTFFTRYYSLVDECGNISAEFTQVINVKDTTRPAISGDMTPITTSYVLGTCDPDLPTPYTTVSELLAENTNVTVADCHLDVNANLVNSSATVLVPGTACPIQYKRTYTITDDCANESFEFYQIINVEDTSRPVPSGDIAAFDTVLIDDATDCGFILRTPFATVAQVQAYDPSWTVTDCNINDTCHVVLKSQDTSATHCPLVITRNYVVLDACGNESAIFHQINNVVDTTRPNIAGAMVNTTVNMNSYSDCGLNDTLVFTSVADLNDANMGITISDCNLNDVLTSTADTVHASTVPSQYAYVITRTYTTTDSCGNTNTFTHTINVRDVENPQMSDQPKDSVIYLTADCDTPTVATFATIADIEAYPGINGAIEVTDCQLVDEVFLDSTKMSATTCPDTITRYYHIIDTTGNFQVFHQTIILQDTTHPTVTGTLPDLTVYADSNCNFTAPTVYATIADLPNVTITDCHTTTISTTNDVVTSDLENCLHYVTRSYTISDECGNDTIIKQRIDIFDTIRPWFTTTITDTIADTLGISCEFLIPDIVPAFAGTDNCYTDVAITQSPAAGDPSGLSYDGITSTVVTVTITDSCGNFKTFDVNLGLPQQIQITSLVVDSAWCDPANTGSITVNAEYGVGTYEYSVDRINWQNSNVIENLTAGNYEVTVLDGNECPANYDTTVYTFSSPVLMAPQVDSVSCWLASDGSISIMAQGGTAPYRYYIEGASDTVTLNAGETADLNGLAVGSYTVAVLDAHNCSATYDTVVGGPDTLAATAALNFREICAGDPVELTCDVTGGTTDYDVTILLNSVADSNFTSGVASPMYQYTYNPEDTTMFTISVEDARGCTASFDTLLIVHPTYEIHDTARVCANIDFDWVGHRLISASEMPTTDTMYIFYDSLSTVTYGCDSVYVLHLKNTNKPYLESRRIYGNDTTALIETPQMNFTYNAGNVSPDTTIAYEFFAQRNCMECSPSIPVSLEFQWFIKNGDTYEQMTQNVTNYFTPTYRTYMDRFALIPQTIQTPHVSVPGAYPNLGQTTATSGHFDFFYLHWLAPLYNLSMIPNPSQNSGTFYSYGRATTLAFTQFRTEGEYMVTVALSGRTPGNQRNEAGYPMTECSALVGGNSSSLTGTVYAVDTVYFSINGSMTAPQPVVSPMEGIVSGNSVGVVPSANVYPNPAREFVQVELRGFEGETSIMLSNSDGKVLHTLNVDIADTESTPIIKINTSDFAQGIYMVTARSKDVVVTKRVVIIR